MKLKKARMQIRPERCKSCRLCVAACPEGAIRISDKLNDMGYHPAEFFRDECAGCGICYIVCPEPGCIKVFSLDPQD
jgi:NAD-dependent dihydropyrimidine dehydrogenase PreA subunit